MSSSANGNKRNVTNLWLIDPGIPGHTTQVEGVGRIFQEETGAKCVWISGKSTHKGLVRSLVRRSSRFVPSRLLPYVAKVIYTEIELPRCKPDLIVTSGSKTIPLCRLLKRLTGAPSLFLGSIERPRSDSFDLVVLPATMGLPNEIIVPLVETGQSTERAADAAQSRWPGGVPNNCWTMVLGGSSSTHVFTAQEWRELAAEMNRLARLHGIQWLISTSRRTGIETETLLRATLDPSVIREAIWWGSRPQKGLAAFLSAGEKVFVTRDSMTMVSEAIAVKERAGIICPADCRLGATSIYARYLERLALEGRATFHPTREISISGTSFEPEPIAKSQAKFAAGLIERVRQLL
jgi:mitochondrial fission protein ELM1